jgi:hypothetical protein
MCILFWRESKILLNSQNESMTKRAHSQCFRVDREEDQGQNLEYSFQGVNKVEDRKPAHLLEEGKNSYPQL